MDADVAGALEHIDIPSYVIDRTGVIRWVNEAARRLVGDVEGRQFTTVVATEETRRARELFARRLLGNTDSTDNAMVLVDGKGDRISAELSSVPLTRGDHVIGVFGQVSDLVEEPQPIRSSTSLRVRPRSCACSSEAGRPRRSPRSFT
jgi:PAS domain S-box-containing protein